MKVTDQEIRTLLDGENDNVTVADVNIMLRIAQECGFNSVLMVNRCKPIIRQIATESFTEEAKDDRELASWTQEQKDLTIQAVYIPAIEQTVKIFFNAGLKLHKSKASPQEIADILDSVPEEELERVANEAIKKFEKKAPALEGRVVDIASNGEANLTTKLGQLQTLITNEVTAAFNGETLQVNIKDASSQPQPQLAAFNANKDPKLSAGPKPNTAVKPPKPQGI